MNSKAVIIDIDGTLLDSNDAHARTWVESLAAEGLHVPYERIRPLIGMGGDHLLPEAVGIDEKSELGQRIIQRRERLFLERELPRLQPFPGARELLERFRRDGYRLVVGTSASESTVEALLRQAGVLGLFDVTLTADDAEESKPKPDIVLAALRNLMMEPDDVLMLGDTPYDIEAAARAGVRTVALTCGGWPATTLISAIAIYRDPEDILQHFEASPFATRTADVIRRDGKASKAGSGLSQPNASKAHDSRP